MAFEKPVVVLDNGSFNIKAGFSCDNHPVSIFRTLVGRPNYLRGSYGKEYYDVYIGDEACSKIDDLELTPPVVKGRIVDWDNMERIWHHLFYRELKVAPEDRAVILGCGPTATMEEKIKCCEIFFETLNSPALCIQPQSAMAMYGSGVTTGLCVDLGYATADVIPVFEGGMVSYAHINTGLAGQQISEYIKQSLGDRHIEVIKTRCDVEDIKQLCYITQNSAISRTNFKREFEISSGKSIDVSNEVFMAAEMLFQPNLIRGENSCCIPLHDAVVTACLKCDEELRSELYESIVPCGGMAMIPGLNERLQVELENKIGRSVTILSSPEAYAIAWLGGATLAGLSDTEKMFVQKKQFEDYGARIVRNKFI